MARHWPSQYPRPERLKREIALFNEAFLEVLFKTVPRKDIVGVYFKGSAKKEWDSPIDYVPELSDIDLHIDFRSMAVPERAFGSVERSLAFAAKVEKAYLKRNPDPIHLPRLQIRFLALQLVRKGYISSPKGTVAVLYGAPYSFGTLDIKSAKERARMQLVEEHREFLEKLPFKIPYKLGKSNGAVLKDLIWRISPLGPNVLCFYRVPFDEAWLLNRTSIVKRMRQLGERRLAKDYEGFYLYAWKYWLSDETDFDAARRGVLAGVRVLRRAEEISRKK